MKAFRRAVLTSVVVLMAQAGAGEATPPATGGPLPSVARVLDRYVEALGGRRALERVRSRHIVGEAEMSSLPGSVATWELITKSPDKRLSVLSVQDFGVVVEGCDGKVAWVQNPGMPVTERTGEELAKSRRDALFNRELHMLKLYPDLALKRSETIAGAEAYVAESKPSAGSLERFAFARQSGLLLRQETEVDTTDGRVTATVGFEDYRKVDQLLLPHLLRIRVASPTGNMDVTLRFKQVKHNVPIEDSRFSRPTQ
jgi:hypothetical protein